jgi:RHS repeat-associated protein
VVTTAYDAAGRVTSVTDRDNRSITYAFDNANRQTAQTWLSSTGATVNRVTYTYDNANNLLTAADNSGTYTMGYDALNRVTSQAEPFGVTLTSSYDAADRRTQVQDSLGGVLNSVYDNADRLTSRQLTAGSQQVRVDAGYDNRNDLTGLTRYSDVGGTTLVGTTSYSYDNAMRVTAITNKNAAGTTLSYYDTTYDNANRATSDTWSSTVGTTTYSGTRNYSYDRSSQLLSDGVKTYTYDFNGNRQTAGTQTYQTAADNRMTTDGVWTYTYDNEGNLLQKAKGSGASAVTWNYGWDNLNRMTSVQEITGTSTTTVLVTYVYDVFGNRIQESKWLSSTGLTTVTRHAYDGQNIWADLNTSNGVLARYVYGDGVDQIWARAIPSGQTNAGVVWYLTDRLGSVRDLMDNTGALQDHLDYDGYGNVTESNSSFGDAFKYGAGWTDSLTGWVNFDSRWYDPVAGRWTREDPWGFKAGDENLYRYVRNDPTTYIDPSGRQAEGPDWNEFVRSAMSSHVGGLAGGRQAPDGAADLFTWQKPKDRKGAEKYDRELKATQDFISSHPDWVKAINNKDDLSKNFKTGDYLKFVITPPNKDNPQGQLRVHKMTEGDKTAHIALATPVGAPVWSAGWIKVCDRNTIEFDNESHHYQTTGNEKAKDRAAEEFKSLGIKADPKDKLEGKPK